MGKYPNAKFSLVTCEYCSAKGSGNDCKCEVNRYGECCRARDLVMLQSTYVPALTTKIKFPSKGTLLKCFCSELK